MWQLRTADRGEPWTDLGEFDSVTAATRERTRELGLELVELPAWYDVDDAAALDRLIADTDSEEASEIYRAPATRRAIAAMGLHLLNRAEAAE